MIDASWEGKVQFYELAFGTWIAYLLLVCMWEKLFRTRHDGWRYTLTTLVGGSFYIVNHYFQLAPFYSLLINSYTIGFSVVYYVILVKPLDCSAFRKVFFFSFIRSFHYRLHSSRKSGTLSKRRKTYTRDLHPGVYLVTHLFYRMYLHHPLAENQKMM